MKPVARALLALALLVAPAGASELFVELPGGEKALGSADPAVVRARAVRIDFDALLDDGEMLSPAPAERLTLTLWPGLTVEAVYDEKAALGASDRFAWVGRLTGREDGQVVILAAGGRIVGSVRTAAGAFRIRHAGEGDLHVVEEVDVAGQPGCAEPIGGPEQELFAPELQTKAATDDGSTFDLLVVYTPAARQFLSFLGGLEELVQLSIAEGNTAFANSGVIPRVRLVHMAEIAYDETAPYEELGALLSKVANPADGAMDEVQGLRDRYKADLVQLITRSREGACGIAFLMRGSSNRNFAPAAYGVTSGLCLSPSVTLIHEIGHNLGCNHAPEDPVGQGAFPYSFGFKSPVSNFHTIMAYTCVGGCSQVLHFSNPNVDIQGEVTGTATQNNVLSINNIRTIAANFRVSTATGGTCSKKKSTFVGCKGGTCKVCAEKIADYPNYLVNHPNCVVNTKCKGKGYVKCSKSCPAPTDADR